jgi:DNA-binding CsgD family transcriptional regulator
MLAALGDFDAAEKMVATAREEIATSGDRWCAAAPALHMARVYLAAGRLGDAKDNAMTGLAEAKRHHTQFWTPLALVTLAAIALLHGDARGTRNLVARFHAEPSDGLAAHFCTTCTWIEAQLDEARQGPDRAVDRFSGLYDNLGTTRYVLIEDPSFGVGLTRMALAAHDRRRARSVANCTKRLSTENPGFGSIAAMSSHAGGLFTRDSTALEQAAEEYTNIWARASAAEDLGILTRGTVPVGPARRQLQSALALYRDIGATRDVDRVHRRLGDVSGRRSRPVSGLGSLTNTEAKVAHFAAQGLTNRNIAEAMFLSRHTVDFHMRQVYRKLAINSRVALTTMLLGLD